MVEVAAVCRPPHQLQPEQPRNQECGCSLTSPALLQKGELLFFVLLKFRPQLVFLTVANWIRRRVRVTALLEDSFQPG